MRTSRRTCRGTNKVADIFNIFFVSVKLPETHRTQQKRVYLCFLEKEYRSSGKQTNKQQQQMNKQKLDQRFAVKILNGHF